MPMRWRVKTFAAHRLSSGGSELDKLKVPRVVLTRLAVAGLLDRVGRGLYRLPGFQGILNNPS